MCGCDDMMRWYDMRCGVMGWVWTGARSPLALTHLLRSSKSRGSDKTLCKEKIPIGCSSRFPSNSDQYASLRMQIRQGDQPWCPMTVASLHTVAQGCRAPLLKWFIENRNRSGSNVAENPHKGVVAETVCQIKIVRRKLLKSQNDEWHSKRQWMLRIKNQTRYKKHQPQQSKVSESRRKKVLLLIQKVHTHSLYRVI